MNNNSNKYNFYETPEWVCSEFGKYLKSNDLKNVIDLGAGKGSILRSLKNKFPKIEVISIEINKSYNKYLKKISSQVSNKNLLKTSLSVIGNKYKEDTLVVSNPPFQKIPINKHIRSLLIKTECISAQCDNKCTRTEIVFIARALEAFHNETRMAFLVPRNIATGKKYELLRKGLINRHKLHKIVLLPSGVFSNTEIETMIIFFRKNSGKSKQVNVYSALHDNSNKVTISNEEFIDGDIYKTKSNNKKILGNISCKVTRGKSTAKSLRGREIPHIHTSDILLHHKKSLKLKNTKILKLKPSEKYATEGDILIARVGTRCMAKTVILKTGRCVITDCVIRLKVPKYLQTKVFKLLTSTQGQDLLKSTASGICAKFITYEALKRLPI